MLEILTLIPYMLNLCMESLDSRICPICSRKGLMQANGANRIGKQLVVCSNENYTHWRLGGNHFLTRTMLNVVEEDSDNTRLDLMLN